MQLDAADFPIVWLRGHDHNGDDHDEAVQYERARELLARRERFVLIVEKMPDISDDADDDAEDRRQRAKMLKMHRAEIARLCVGIILIGRASNLPVPFKKFIQGVTSIVGVALLFAESEASAVHLARERLDDVTGSKLRRPSYGAAHGPMD